LKSREGLAYNMGEASESRTEGKRTGKAGRSGMKVCIRILQDDRGGYMAVCPSLPGCMSRGETREQAREKLNEAIRGYIAAVSNCVPETVVHEVVEA